MAKSKFTFNQYAHAMNYQGEPIVYVKINGNLQSFLLDTSSEMNVLSRELWEKYKDHGEVLGNTMVLFDGVECEWLLVKLSFTIQKATYTEQFAVMPNGTSLKSQGSRIWSYEGSLGNLFLRNNKFIIDYKKNRIYVYKETPKKKWLRKVTIKH